MKHIDRLFAEAASHLSKEELEDAKNCYLEIIKLDELNHVAYNNIAIVNAKLGRDVKANHYLQIALILNETKVKYWQALLTLNKNQTLFKIDQVFHFLNQSSLNVDEKTSLIHKFDIPVSERPNSQPSNKLLQEVINNIGEIPYSDVKETVIELTSKFPFNADFFNLLGTIELIEKNYSEAKKYTYIALVINSTLSEAKKNYALILARLGMVEEADKLFENLMREFPNDQECLYNYSQLNIQLKNKSRAESYLRKIITLNPHHKKAIKLLSEVLSEQGRLHEMFSLYESLIDSTADNSKLISEIALMYFENADYDNACKYYIMSVAIETNSVASYLNLGESLRYSNRRDEAVKYLESFINNNGDNVQILNNLGIIKKELGLYREAEKIFQRAEALHPTHVPTRKNLGLLQLKLGRYQDGFKNYDYRLPAIIESKQISHIPLWRERNKNEKCKVLIWSEQGPGDCIIWADALRLLRTTKCEFLIEVSEKLLPVLRASFPELNFQVEGSIDFDATSFDYQLPLGSIFRIMMEELRHKEPSVPYITAPMEYRNYWRKTIKELGPDLKVGISWKSPLLGPIRNQNYTKILSWKPLLQIPNIKFINLQSTDFNEDLNFVENDFGVTIHHFEQLDQYNDLINVAALTQELDCVISVATTVAQIASAVGTETDILTWEQSAWNCILFTSRGPRVNFHLRNTWENWDQSFAFLEKKYKSLSKLKSNSV